MKIYCPNIKEGGIGGGWTFLRNLRNGLKDRVHFVRTWQECDIYFITGVTITDPGEANEAKRAGKKIVLRVDNVPRKSRNRRQSPHQRLKEFAEMSDVVIYQSEWAKEYCFPLCGEGTIIYNGVDQNFFKRDDAVRNENRYLFAYHGKNEQKAFWHAHVLFQQIFRKNPKAEFYFINDFGRETEELERAGFDFWNGEPFVHLPRQDTPEDMRHVLQQCAHLIYPAIADASPNMVLEARACGLDIIGAAPRDISGTQELVELEDISLERMCDEYYGVFSLLANE